MAGVITELIIELSALALVAVPDGFLFCTIEKSEGKRKEKYKKIRAAWEIICLVGFFAVIYFLGTH